MKNRKTLLNGMSVVFVSLLIVISTITQAGIDPAKWKSTEFISNLLIVLAICIFGIMTGNGEGENHYKTKKDGLFITTYDEYNTQREIINPYVDKFSDWNKIYYEKEAKEKALRHLKINFGIKQAEDILNLDRTEIKQLEKPCKFGEIYFKSLTVEQIEEVLKVLDGKIKLEFVHDSYFLNAFSKSKDISMYEQAGKQEKTKREKFTGLLVYRLFFTIMVSLIFAGMQSDGMNGENIGQILLNLTSRLFSLASSISWGFFIANEMIKDECVFLSYKKRVLETFYLELVVNKTYIPITEQEKAVLEYNQFMEGENKNEQENILDKTCTV